MAGTVGGALALASFAPGLAARASAGGAAGVLAALATSALAYGATLRFVLPALARAGEPSVC